MLATIPPILTTLADESLGAGGTIFAIIIGLMALAFVILFVGLFIFWVVMVIDALQRQNWPNNDQRTLWLIILVASFFLQLSWIAAIIYYFAMKKPLDRGEVPSFFENQKPSAAPVSEPTKAAPKKSPKK